MMKNTVQIAICIILSFTSVRCLAFNKEEENMIAMRESSLYIALAGTISSLDNKAKAEVENVFKDVFNEAAVKLSDIQESGEVELVYEIQTPVIKDDTLVKEFYENLEVLLEELKEHNPHFTQFKREDK